METVLLDGDTIEKCKQWAAARQEQNTGHGDAREYRNNAVMKYTSEEANLYGLMGEVAVCQWLGLPVDQQRWVVYRDSDGRYEESLSKNADLFFAGRKVEVRNITYLESPLKIKDKDIAADALMVKVYVEVEDGQATGKVTLMGWTNARNASLIGKWSKYGYYQTHVAREMEHMPGVKA